MNSKDYENVEAVSKSFLYSPKCSTRKLVTTLGLSALTIRGILHLDLKFYFHQVMGVLFPLFENRLACCQRLLAVITGNAVVLPSAEAHFCLSCRNNLTKGLFGRTEDGHSRRNHRNPRQNDAELGNSLKPVFVQA